MGQQLHALGLADTPTIDAQSSAARQLMDMYEVMGNVLSRQVACRVRVKPTYMRSWGMCCLDR